MNDLRQKIQDKEARVAVVDLGYVGLPLAVIFAEAGFNVTGLDVDKDKVQAICLGESYIQDVPKGRLAALVRSGKLQATDSFEALRHMDAVSICVPTPLRKTGDPHLSYILDAVDELAYHVHPGMVVVLESTTYPGTTREILLPRLAEARGLTAGKDFYLAFSPERVDPGRTDWTTLNTPKVIGGITSTCTEVAA